MNVKLTDRSVRAYQPRLHRQRLPQLPLNKAAMRISSGHRHLKDRTVHLRGPKLHLYHLDRLPVEVPLPPHALHQMVLPICVKIRQRLYVSFRCYGRGTCQRRHCAADAAVAVTYETHKKSHQQQLLQQTFCCIPLRTKSGVGGEFVVVCLIRRQDVDAHGVPKHLAQAVVDVLRCEALRFELLMMMTMMVDVDGNTTNGIA